MIRGAFYGSVGAALAIALSTDVEFPLVLVFAVFVWMFVLFFAGLPLILAAAFVQPTQRMLKRVLPGRLFVPMAVLAAVPFGMLVCMTVMRLTGWTTDLWTDPRWISVLRVAFAGSIGLGLGCVHDVTGQDY